MGRATRARSLFLGLALLGLQAGTLEAQEGGPLRFSIEPRTGEAVVVVGDLLADEGLAGAVTSGLPLRIRILIQLWRDEFFDNQESQYEWRATVIYDALTRRYRVQTGAEGGVEKEVNTLDEARATLQQTLEIPLRPNREGRYYYDADVEMETLSLSDLEELQRWLRGDLAPVVAGDEAVENALGRGLRRLFVRMLGLPARRFRVRSPPFSMDPPAREGQLPGSALSPSVPTASW